MVVFVTYVGLNKDLKIYIWRNSVKIARFTFADVLQGKSAMPLQQMDRKKTREKPQMGRKKTRKKLQMSRKKAGKKQQMGRKKAGKY
jgi:hypothetical protein